MATDPMNTDRMRELAQPSPPGLRGLISEATAGVLASRMWLEAFRLRDLPRGDGAAALVLPGFGASDASTLPLRSFLSALGYRVSGWRMGRNRGNVPELIPRVVDRVAETANRFGEPVRLVGWSLGGVLAREAAREQPELVDRVITLGSPVVGGPKYTNVASLYRALGWDLDEIEREIEERNRIPIQVPVVAIYSRRDGVVDWRACVDRVSSNVDHVEVSTSHLLLGIDPTVLAVLAQRMS